MNIRAEASRFVRLTAKAKKLGAALFTMAGLYQVEPVRAVVMPQLIRHPHVSSIAGFLFGVWLLLHNPTVQDAGTRVAHMLHPVPVPRDRHRLRVPPVVPTGQEPDHD